MEKGMSLDDRCFCGGLPSQAWDRQEHEQCLDPHGPAVSLQFNQPTDARGKTPYHSKPGTSRNGKGPALGRRVREPNQELGDLLELSIGDSEDDVTALSFASKKTGLWCISILNGSAQRPTYNSV